MPAFLLYNGGLMTTSIAKVIPNLIGATWCLIVGAWLIIAPAKLFDFVSKIYKMFHKHATLAILPDSFFLGGRPVFGKVLGIIMVSMAIAGLYLNLKALL